MATYNGAAHLTSQIESICGQTYTQWQLWIHDDGSQDGTNAIIDYYCKQYPQKIIRIHGNFGGSATKNFMGLLALANAPYIMFADQDDVWLPHKIAIAVAALESVKDSNKTPILVFTDMHVVNSEAKLLHASFMRMQCLVGAWAQKSLYTQVQSMAAGCTMLFNKALVDRLHPIDDALFQHDHWLLMHATTYGKTIFLPEPTVLYRQHGANSIGAHPIDNQYYGKKLATWRVIFKRWRHIRRFFVPKPAFAALLFAKIYLNVKRKFQMRLS